MCTEWTVFSIHQFDKIHTDGLVHNRTDLHKATHCTCDGVNRIFSQKGRHWRMHRRSILLIQIVPVLIASFTIGYFLPGYWRLLALLTIKRNENNLVSCLPGLNIVSFHMCGCAHCGQLFISARLWVLWLDGITWLYLPEIKSTFFSKCFIRCALFHGCKMMWGLGLWNTL